MKNLGGNLKFRVVDNSKKSCYFIDKFKKCDSESQLLNFSVDKI